MEGERELKKHNQLSTMSNLSGKDQQHNNFVMGYPPIQNYPQPPYHPGNFHNYAPPPPKTVAYDQPLSSFSYCQPMNYRHLEPDSFDNDSTFIRFVVIFLVVLLAALCATTLIIWLLFGTEVPDITVSSFFVPTFNITNLTTLFATWEGNVIINNSDENLEVQFTRSKSSIFYRDNILALAYMDPFNLTKHSKHNLPVKLSTKGLLQNPKESVLEMLDKDRKSGTMVFSLRMVFEAKFKSNSLWRNESLKVLCENMKVEFPDATGGGKLITSDTSHECLMFS